MEKLNSRSRKGKYFKYLPILIILLSITIMIGSTFAYFSDKASVESVFTFNKVELSQETQVGVNGVILDVLPGVKFVDSPISFSKAIDSAPIYVRAKLSFSLPKEYRDDIKMQELLNALRSSSSFDIESEEQNGAIWSAKQGSYFYLVDKDAPTRLKMVNDTYTYTLSNQIAIPRDIEQLADNYQYMKSINFHIAFEAIQADNVSNVLKDTKLIFNEVFPSDEAMGAAVNVTLKDFNLVDILEILQYQEGDTVFQPLVELPTDDYGNTTISVEGWFVDKDLTIPYVFGNKIYEDITLYPKTIEIPEGLEFIPIYNSQDVVIAYKVAMGTCLLTNIKLPSFYNNKPVTTIAEDGFRDCADITNIELTDKITTIEANGFNGCIGLTTMRIPVGVTSIGEDAFLGCVFTTTVTPSVENWLNIQFEKENANPINISKNLYIENNVATYSLRSSSVELTHLEPPASCTKINAYAFYNCHTLASVTLGANITEIGEFAFYGCFNVTEVDVQGDPDISDGAFEGTNAELPIIPKEDENGDSTVGGYNDTGVKDVTVPDGVAGISQNGFANSSLEKIQFPDSLEYIAEDAFKDCKNLTNITFPSGVGSIGKNAFKGCSSLSSVTFKFGSQITAGTTIEPDAFEETPIEEVIIEVEDGISYEQALEIWLSMKFANEYSNPTFYARKLTLAGIVLTELVVPNSITEINPYAFINVETLTKTTIPSHVTKIGEKAFYGCINNKIVNNNSALDIVAGEITHGYVAYYMVDNGLVFTEVKNGNTVIGYEVSLALDGIANMVIPDKYNGLPVIKVADYGFSRKTNIKQIVLPDSITTIGIMAFRECTSLEVINIPKNVKDMDLSCLYGCTNLKTLYYDAISVNSSAGTPNLGIINNNGNTYGIDLYIGPKVKDIPVSAFRGETYDTLKSVNFVDGVELNSIGGYAFYGVSVFNELTLPKVTTIDVCAFEGCSNLTKVVIQSGLTEIKSSAFKSCEKLEEIVLPETLITIGNSAFESCTSLVSVDLPDSLTTIGNIAFRMCSALEEVNIPKNVKTLNNIFSSCSNLKTIYFEAIKADDLSENNTVMSGINVSNIDIYISADVEYIPSYLFASSVVNSVTFAENSKVKVIGKYAFQGATSIEELELPNNLTTINAYAFENCTGITSIIIPDKVTSIGYAAFRGCTNLSNVILNDSITIISDEVFRNNVKLATIQLPSNLLEIGYKAFMDSGLTSINLPNTLTSIDEEAFNGCKLTSINLPSHIISVGDGAFANCTELSEVFINARTIEDIVYSYYVSIGAFANIGTNTSSGATITIGKNVQTIGSRFAQGAKIKEIIFESDSQCTQIGVCAFYNVVALTEITLPDSITTLGSDLFSNCQSLIRATLPKDYSGSLANNMFYGCINLEEVILGDKITAIGDSVFSNCKKLNFTSLPSGITSIGYSAFSRCENLTLTSIPDDIKTIDSYAFNACKKLALTKLPSKLTNIASEVFYDCTSLAITEVPSGISRIEMSAFRNCTSIKLLILPSSITTVDEYAFYGSGIRYLIKNSNVSITASKVGLTSSSIYSVATGAVPNLSTEVEIVINDTLTIYSYTDTYNTSYKVIKVGDVYYW